MKKLINPKSTKKNDSFLFRTLDSSNNIICESKAQYFFSSTPGLITIVKENMRNETEVGKPVEFSFSFKNENNFPKGALIIITIPTTQLLISDKSKLKCSNSILNTTLACSINNELASKFTLQFTEFCTQNMDVECQVNKEQFLKIEGAFTNPQYVPSSDSELFFISITHAAACI